MHLFRYKLDLGTKSEEGKISIRDVMVPISEYSIVNENTLVKDAVQILKKSYFWDETGGLVGHRSILVTNKKGDLVGIVTLRNILKAVLTKQDLPDNYLWIYSVNACGANMPVKALMRPIKAFFVNADDSMYKVIDSFLTKKVNSLPVAENGKLIGIVRTVDVFEVMGNLL